MGLNLLPLKEFSKRIKNSMFRPCYSDLGIETIYKHLTDTYGDDVHFDVLTIITEFKEYPSAKEAYKSITGNVIESDSEQDTVDALRTMDFNNVFVFKGGIITEEPSTTIY